METLCAQKLRCGDGRKIDDMCKIKRQANIELLRIISMLLVLVIHYNVGINGQTSHEMVMTQPWKAAGVASLKSLSFVCVNCFIIISGYFGIRWKWKGLFNYLFQISFWGGLVHLIAVAIGHCDFSFIRMMNNMTLFLANGNWFFITYLGLYMFAPVLNAFIEKVTTKELGIWILVFYTFQTVFGYVIKNCQEFNQGLTFVSFIGLYFLGAFIKRSGLKCFQWKTVTNLMVYLGVGAFCVMLSMFSNYYGASKDVYSYISPLQIIQTIYLFLCCKAMVIKRGEKVILFFSSSAFAALLMHSWEGAAIYKKGLIWINNNVAFPFVMTVFYILLFFVLAVFLDKIRIWIWNKLQLVQRKDICERSNDIAMEIEHK